jgi:hypothetical protein
MSDADAPTPLPMGAERELPSLDMLMSLDEPEELIREFIRVVAARTRTSKRGEQWAIVNNHLHALRLELERKNEPPVRE